MTKVLLALVLLTAQSLSWAGTSLYLCLEGDGSFCVDSGPNTCHCGHDGEAHEHEGIATGGAPPAKPQALSDANCQCVHFLLLSQQPTVVVTRPLSHDNAGLALVAIQMNDSVPALSTVELVSFANGESPASFSTLTQRASVVLRC